LGDATKSALLGFLGPRYKALGPGPMGKNFESKFYGN